MSTHELTVRELIELLKACNPDAKLRTYGECDSLQPVGVIQTAKHPATYMDDVLHDGANETAEYIVII